MYLFMAALGLSFGSQDLHRGMWDLLLWGTGALWLPLPGFSRFMASGILVP